MSAAKLDVLAFAAHCDDVEITSGGLLIKLADQGYKVGVCDLTAGEMGSKGSKSERLAESQCAGQVLGLTQRVNLELPDAGLEVNRANTLKLVEVIRAHQPRLVILPYWEQRHPDHRICSLLGQDACFLAGLRKLEAPGEPHRPFKVLFSTYYREATGAFLVDITPQFERKLEAVRCYKSQFDGTPISKEIFDPGVDIFTMMTIRDQALGLKIKVPYAEAYLQREPFQVDDPLALKVRSV